MPTSKEKDSRHVTFYADKDSITNKLFDFKVNDCDDAIRCAQYFVDRNWYIRIAWFHESNWSKIIAHRGQIFKHQTSV